MGTRILFVHTTVILNFFLKKDGFETLHWLFSRKTKREYSLQFVTSREVCSEFQDCILRYPEEELPLLEKERIFQQSAEYRKNRRIRIVGKASEEVAKNVTTHPPLRKNTNVGEIKLDRFLEEFFVRV